LYLSTYRTRATKPDTQILATALSCYVTSSKLAGTTKASRYGFVVSSGGCCDHTYNVGPYGKAIGLTNSTDYTVMQLLQQADAMNGAGTFDANAFKAIFTGINESGKFL